MLAMVPCRGGVHFSGNNGGNNPGKALLLPLVKYGDVPGSGGNEEASNKLW